MSRLSLLFSITLVACSDSAPPTVEPPPPPPKKSNEVCIVGARGELALIEAEAPWRVRNGVTIGATSSVRFDGGQIFAVLADSDEVVVVDLQRLVAVASWTLDVGSMPRDVALVGDAAYVSLYQRDGLQKLDRQTGAVLDWIDLSAFADADGLPETGRLLVAGERLFVQLRRIDRATGEPVAPSMIAIVDTTRDVLVDADPSANGVQAIALSGPRPAHDMQVFEEELWVSEPSAHLWGNGGLEAVNLQTLTARGLLVTETQLGGRVGAFLIAADSKAYLINHTDVSQSSHLHAFSPLGSVARAPIYDTFEVVDRLVFDGSHLYLPDPCSTCSSGAGVAVFDTDSSDDRRLAFINVGFTPVDAVLIVRE